MMGALMRELDMTDRAEALAWIHSVTGKDISSRNELTRHDATTVIDALVKAKDDGANPTTGEVVQAELVDDGGWPETAPVKS